MQARTFLRIWKLLLQATQIASVVRPALTTIKQPLYDMGAVAMRMLTKLMNNEEVDDIHVQLPYELLKK